MDDEAPLVNHLTASNKHNDTRNKRLNCHISALGSKLKAHEAV